jgi:hypothetical protein
MIDGGSAVSFTVEVSKMMLDMITMMSHSAFDGKLNPSHPKVIVLQKAADQSLTRMKVVVHLKGVGWDWTDSDISGHPDIMFFSVPHEIKRGGEKVPTPNKTTVVMMDFIIRHLILKRVGKTAHNKDNFALE